MISDAKRYCESLTVICRKESRSAAWPTPTCHFQPYRLPLSLRKQHALATSFPIKNAWTIADALGCSIDSLVGRGTDVPENSESGIFLRQFESLSEDGRRLVSEFMELAAKHEEEAKERRRIEIAAKYKPYLNEFLGQFIAKFDHGGGQDVVSLIGGESAFGVLFKSFVESRAELVMQGEQDEKFEEAKEVYANLGYAEFTPISLTPSAPPKRPPAHASPRTPRGRGCRARSGSAPCCRSARCSRTSPMPPDPAPRTCGRARAPP